MKSSLSLTLFLVFALLALSSVLADDAGKRKKSLRATNRDIEVEDELEQMIPGLSRDLHEVEDDEDEDEEDEEDEDEEDGYGESNSLDLPEGDEYDEYEPEGYYRRRYRYGRYGGYRRRRWRRGYYGGYGRRYRRGYRRGYRRRRYGGYW
uniref:Uncharacterized protein n=1 Tax=Leptocylindrus danicus TaxID=163516 RepID=A0A6U2S1W1_9STRA|mmetsp:Transcript_5369/g.7874  ORF Transcript_5369/g.7874 Transcript_5369/m.7874 type:complete len:150 (+) Transcript_5369:65-514(+)